MILPILAAAATVATAPVAVPTPPAPPKTYTVTYTAEELQALVTQLQRPTCVAEAAMNRLAQQLQAQAKAAKP
jgi:hypothetical protein